MPSSAAGHALSSTVRRGDIRTAAINAMIAAVIVREDRVRDAVESISDRTHRLGFQVYRNESSSERNHEIENRLTFKSPKISVKYAIIHRLVNRGNRVAIGCHQTALDPTRHQYYIRPMTNAQERKAQERQARRRRIQEAARTVFTERGYAGASIELIARAAQLSVGAIYLYFRSKEDLYVSLIEDTLTVFDVEMAQIREQAEPSNRLRDTWSILVRWAEKDAEGPRILRLLAQPAIRPQLSDEVVSAVSAGIGRVQDHIGACVADGIHAGIYRQVNAREIADLAWSVLLGSLDAAEMHTNIGLGTEVLATRTDRALQLIESALVPSVSGSLRAVA
jgi:AcrR family transcriptional regulator